MADTNTDADTNDEEEEDVQYFAGSQGPNREEMTGDYMPDQDDWIAKTILDLNDPGSIAALRQFDTLFPEVEDLQPVIDDFLDVHLKGKTSIAGSSRDEYQDILMAMYGGKSDSKGNALAEAFAADMADDD